MKIMKKLANVKHTRAFAILLGLAATVWFLIRVIPKPSRAAYPCMKAAAPLMSSFVIYLIGISASVFSFKKFKSSIKSSRYLVSAGFVVLFLVSLSVFVLNDPTTSLASSLKSVNSTFPVASNQPVGTAVGLFPGRVVWVHDLRATNEDYDPNSAGSEWWYSDVNCNEAVVKNMLETALKEYAEQATASEAWNAIFVAFNESHDRGSVGYTAGEKIAIKVNMTNSCCTPSPKRMDIAPQLMNALLDQLINVVGVDPSDITIGDPYRNIRNEYVNLVINNFPDVVYTDGNAGGVVLQTVPSDEEVLKFSNGTKSSTLPQHYLDATYFINMPCLKTHNEGGITLIAKNHQGSYLKSTENPSNQSAMAMHPYLPANSSGVGQYRHTVDYMGHKDTGGKGLIYIVDALWAGESWEGWIKKFKMDPFNDDYPNSLLVGQDPVAIESVGFDILFEEYDQDAGKPDYPINLKNEIADYLLQCASSENWADGITYDPEGDGSPIGSLGVFEHWNNATDRQYSRNLGEDGTGVELKYVSITTAIEAFVPEILVEVAPNPFHEYTVFRAQGKVSDRSELFLYNLSGQLVNRMEFGPGGEIRWDGTDSKGISLSSGVYIYTVSDDRTGMEYSGRVVLAEK